MISKPANPAQSSANRQANGHASESPLDWSLSPSLRPRATRGPSYELKFVLNEALARQVESRLAPHLTLDPHADASLGGAYRTHTLYLDTDEFDILRGVEGFRRRKHRARWYGAAEIVFLERKTKAGDRVSKKRCRIDLGDFGKLENGGGPAGWPAEWFVRQVRQRGLAPRCVLTYERTAFFGEFDSVPVRLTFDRSLRGTLVSEWRPTRVPAERPVLLADVICEFKFAGAMPAVFKRTIEELQLAPVRFSKYRLCMQSQGFAERTEPRARLA